MGDFDSIESLAAALREKLDSVTKENLVLYAFNATGKTRLSNILNQAEGDDGEGKTIKALCYNSFLEDVFVWDNENTILKFDTEYWILQLIADQGLDNAIVDNFKNLVQAKIDPVFNFESGEITFRITSGDDQTTGDNIKISRGEESVFIWCVFYSVLETAVEALNAREEDRTTRLFDTLKYIIIDDPVSSIDDTRIIAMALQLIEVIRASNSNNVKFLITTHHALFYNVLANSSKAESREKLFESYSLSKDNQVFKLAKQGDSPFSYHLTIKELLEKAIQERSIERYHFNIFRNLLEKTSNFLGYENWADCISSENKQEFIRLLNLYSHSRLSEVETREISARDKELFEMTFKTFVERFKWRKGVKV